MILIKKISKTKLFRILIISLCLFIIIILYKKNNYHGKEFIPLTVKIKSIDYKEGVEEIYQKIKDKKLQKILLNDYKNKLIINQIKDLYIDGYSYLFNTTVDKYLFWKGFIFIYNAYEVLDDEKILNYYIKKDKFKKESLKTNKNIILYQSIKKKYNLIAINNLISQNKKKEAYDILKVIIFSLNDMKKIDFEWYYEELKYWDFDINYVKSLLKIT